MKKFIYSTYTKVFAVILFLTSLTLGVLSGVRCGELILAEGDYIYDFGSSMEDSYYLRHLVSLPETAVLSTCSAYAEAAVQEDTSSQDSFAPTEETLPWEYTEPTASREPVPVSEALLKQVEQRLEDIYYKDRIEYYVNLNGTVFTNTSVTEPEALAEGLYKYYAIDSKGQVTFHSGRGAYMEPYFYGYELERMELQSLTIVTRITDSYASEYGAMWNRQEGILYTAGARILVCVLGLLLSLIYLICVCGRDAEGHRKCLWTDRIWAELHLAAMGAFGVGGTFLCAVVIDAAFQGEFPLDGAYLICSLIPPLAGGLILSSLLSLIRNLKAGLFAKRCGVLIILKYILSWLWTFCKAIWRGLCAFGRTLASARGIPLTIMQIGLLLIYTVTTVFLVALIDNGAEMALVFLILLYLAAAFLLARKGKDMADIQKGAARIRSGDLSHGIPEPKSVHLKPLAENINHIAKGLDASLAGRLKAERMKTELITNVSHDLKTPLTSIINYTELLSKVEGLPEEAGDYIRIIGDKSQRLKNLTQDLFAISKVQSGNEEVNWELLDAAILLEQSLAEEKGEDTASTLQFCLKAEDGLTFMGDGRKLSRVMGNLIQNAVKYAMPGTRVFLSAYKEADRVVIECKNVSAYPLDFSPEEVLGRFVRGDSSRSTEGNGLGLPIAKSYTELCGGDFTLLLDGDLFKVLLSFPTAQ